MGRLRFHHQRIPKDKRVPIKKMQEVRKKKNLSFDALALITEIPAKVLWEIESGYVWIGSVSDARKKRISEWLNVKMEELFGEVEVRKEPENDKQ